jgi:hypothetical protein
MIQLKNTKERKEGKRNEGVDLCVARETEGRYFKTTTESDIAWMKLLPTYLKCSRATVSSLAVLFQK